MAISDIDRGSSPNDGTGTTLRAGATIINQILDMWNFITGVSGNIIFSGGKVSIGSSTADSTLHVYEDTAITGAAAGVTIQQNGIGDAITQFLIGGAQRWVIGIDNSDTDKFKIASASDLDTNAYFTIDVSGNIGVNKINPGSKFAVSGLPVYANNAAALSGGLTEGDFYKTAATGDATVMVTNAT